MTVELPADLPIPAPHPPSAPTFIPAEEIVAYDTGISSDERGWTISEEEYLRRKRYRFRRRLVTVEREVEILRLYHRGTPVRDIATQLDVSPSTVYASVQRAMKRSVDKAGAKDERNKQLLESEIIAARLMERILPDPAPDGSMSPVDIKAVDAWVKLARRRAELTGADAPAKVQVHGQVEHVVAAETIERVDEYISLVESMMESGYGSGRAPELEVTNIIDAEEVVIPDMRPLADRVADRPKALTPHFDSRPEEAS